MYKELILDNKNAARAHPQEPALPAEIEDAEKAVGYPFPTELRELLSEMNGDGWLFFSTEQIKETVAVNREYLLECYDGIERHIFFAGNGCGDCYCYNIDSDGGADVDRIYIWQHETNETDFVASNLAELIRRYYNDEI